jgi:hypothetical protein
MRHLVQACGLLGLRDRDFRECDVDTIQEAFTRRVTVPQGDPHAASKAKYLAKNHIYIHEAYQFLLKKKQAQMQQQQQQQVIECSICWMLGYCSGFLDGPLSAKSTELGDQGS